MLLPIGQTIDDKYRIVRLIGEGGMGAVYEGENVRINRRVAIKVLHSAVEGNKEAVKRFEREAQAAGRIGNDHILEVLDLGLLPGAQHYMVMEYLEGEPLSARIRRLRRLAPEEAHPLIRQVLMGLDAAHSVGIVHRDLKPDNIFVIKEKYGQKDFVKIIDFGVSKFNTLTDDMRMTRTGAVVGTPFYMAPEQASGGQCADARSDVYAVGVILYECITGHVPFDAPTFNQLMFQIVLSAPIPAQTLVPDLDPAFATIISKAMARDPTYRFGSCKDLVFALDDWLAHRTPVTVPPTGDPYALIPVAPVVPASERDAVARDVTVVTPPSAELPLTGAEAQQTQPGGFTPPRAQPVPTYGATLRSEPAPLEDSPKATSALGTTMGAGRGSWSSSGVSLPKSSRRVWVAAIGAVVIAMAALFAWSLLWHRPEPPESGTDARASRPEVSAARAPAVSKPADPELPTVTPAVGDGGVLSQASAPSTRSTGAGAQATPSPPSRGTPTGGSITPAPNRVRGTGPARGSSPARGPDGRTPPDFGY